MNLLNYIGYVLRLKKKHYCIATVSLQTLCYKVIGVVAFYSYFEVGRQKFTRLNTIHTF